MNTSTSESASPGRDPYPMPAAALWDFDGTLVDTEPIWVRGQFAMADRLGIAWTETDAVKLVGNSLIDSGRYIVAVLDEQLGTGHGWTPQGLIDELATWVSAEIASSAVPWRPGAQQLLASFAESGVPCALVSASYRRVLAAVLDRLPAQTFAAVVAGDEVNKGKPDPEPYLIAAQRLGVPATDCVVLEDSVPGCTSGNAAGATVLAIQHLVAIPPHPSRVIIDTLVGLSAADIAALVAGATPDPDRTPTHSTPAPSDHS